MSLVFKLPSRYEQLSPGFRGKLKPNPDLIKLVTAAVKKRNIIGGIGFLPVFGESGCGKTSATLELGTHLPDFYVFQLSHSGIATKGELLAQVRAAAVDADGRPMVAVVDQYEEQVATREELPTSFVESLSLLDRNELQSTPIIFVWLTTSRDFQKALVKATSRNSRILVSEDFEIKGPSREDWPEIISETFSAHNSGAPLSEYDILGPDLTDLSKRKATLGDAIESVAEKLAESLPDFQNLSDYRVVMLWPVTDATRITRIHGFTDPKQGYKLNFDAWYRTLNKDDQAGLPLHAYNRARLYFDLRLIPIAAADLMPICQNLQEKDFKIHNTYRERIEKTHLFSILSENWIPDSYSPLRERDSQRAAKAKEWYTSVTNSPTAIGRRLAQCFTELGLPSKHEEDVSSRHATVRADVLCSPVDTSLRKVIVELKAFAPENTMPSTIASQIRQTLKRHAQFAGFLSRQ